MSEKKRKRREEGAERPKKKVAIAEEGKVQVELLENREPLGPILGMRKIEEHNACECVLSDIQLPLLASTSPRAYRSTPTNVPRSFLTARPTTCSSNPRNMRGWTMLLRKNQMAAQRAN